jgi:hypothetical protein
MESILPIIIQLISAGAMAGTAGAGAIGGGLLTLIVGLIKQAMDKSRG